MRSKNVVKAVVTSAIAAGMVFGATAPAMAQGFGSPSLGSPSFSSPGFNSPGIMLPQSNSEKKKLGSIGGPVWSADVYSQVVRGGKVFPGRTVTVRIEVVGTKGEAKLRQIGHNMPNDFKLVSITRQSASLLGAGVYTLKPNEYKVVENNNSNSYRLEWTEGGFLGLFQDNPTVNTEKSVTVEFTYQAPNWEGTYQHGGYASIGSVFNPSDNWVVGGEPIVVERSAETALKF